MTRLGIGWVQPADTTRIIDFLSRVRDVYAPVKARCLELMNSRFHYNDDILRIFESVQQAER